MKSILKNIWPVFIVACQSSQDNSNLNVLIQQRDSLKEVYTKIEQQLASIEQEISKLDSSSRKKMLLVTAEKFYKQPFKHFIEVQASVEADQNATINPEFSGNLDKILVKTGDLVSKGQTLAIINTDVLQKNLDELKSALELANTVYVKQKNLWDQKIGSEIQYLQAKNNKESLELKIQSLQSQLQKAQVKAPFDGVVDELFLKEGQLANPAFPLLRIVNLQSLYLKADVSEEYISKIKKGTEVFINFPSLQLESKGYVNRIGNYVEPSNRTFKIEIDLPQVNSNIKPNLIAKANILDYSNDSVIVVPSNIIQQDAQLNSFVFVAHEENGVAYAKKVLITPGFTYKGKTEVLQGLNHGDLLILEGSRTSSDGAMVSIQ